MEYQLQFGEVWRYWDALLSGAWYTTKLTALSAILGLLIGTLGAAGRRSPSTWVRLSATLYVEFVRNTPFIVQLFFVYFALPSAGIKLSAGQAALLAMTLNIGAYFTEIIRAGLDDTERGQLEAALSLGLTKLQTFLTVVVKPAIANVYPALTSQYILVMLGSAVVSQISAEDLTFVAGFIQSRTFRDFEVYFVITGMYLVMALVLKALFSGLYRVLFPWRRYA